MLDLHDGTHDRISSYMHIIFTLDGNRLQLCATKRPDFLLRGEINAAGRCEGIKHTCSEEEEEATGWINIWIKRAPEKLLSVGVP